MHAYENVHNSFFCSILMRMCYCTLIMMSNLILYGVGFMGLGFCEEVVLYSRFCMLYLIVHPCQWLWHGLWLDIILDCCLMFCVVMWMPCGSSSMALFVMQVIEQHQEEELKHGYHKSRFLSISISLYCQSLLWFVNLYLSECITSEPFALLILVMLC